MNSLFLWLPWTLWGCLGLIGAGVYVMLWPRPRAGSLTQPRPTWRHFILRWFHALVWVLLALSCFIRGTLLPGGSGVANVLTLLGLAVYLVFFMTLAVDRRSIP